MATVQRSSVKPVSSVEYLASVFAHAVVTDLCSLPKSQRNRHVQACIRRKVADEHMCLQTDVVYCYQCFNWVVGIVVWKEHCQTHLNGLDSKRCGTITYCNTLIRPAYCPFCLGSSKSAAQRLASWCRDNMLWQHVDKHLQGRGWPVRCPHPLCDLAMNDALELRYHFIDEHGLSRTVPKPLQNLKSWVTVPSHSEHEQENRHKRKSTEYDPELCWPPQEQLSSDHPFKKARQELLTVAPSLLSDLDASTAESICSDDFTTSEFSIYTPKAMSPAPTRAGGSRKGDTKPSLQHPARSQDCDIAVVDLCGDELFSQFIRSPSPDIVPVTATSGDRSPTVVDIDDILPPVSTNLGDNNSTQHNSEPKRPSDGSGETPLKLRIRLRVEPPKTTIKLRLPTSSKGFQSKQKHQAKSCKNKQGRTFKRSRWHKIWINPLIPDVYDEDNALRPLPHAQEICDSKVIELLREKEHKLGHASRQSFADVSLEINKRLREAEKRLSQIGGPRQTSEAQRSFLLSIASKYQTLANKATDAYYGRDQCFLEKPTLRLAALVMKEDEQFAKVLCRKESKHFVRPDHQSDTEPHQEDGLDVDDAEVNGEVTDTSDEHHESLGDIFTEFPRLVELLTIESCGEDRNEESMKSRITRMSRASRCFEIGSSNPSLITALVHDETSSWEYIALKHAGEVIVHIHRCIKDLLECVCPDERIRMKLRNKILPGLSKSYDAAIEHTLFLVKVERTGYPITVNHYFAQTMQKRRNERLQRRLKEKKVWSTNDDNCQPLLLLTDVVDAYVSNEQQHVEELTDVLESYVKVMRKRFADNVCKQSIDHYLVRSPEGPLHILSPDLVGRFSLDEIENLGGEAQFIAEQRQKLQAEVETLTQGRAILAET